MLFFRHRSEGLQVNRKTDLRTTRQRVAMNGAHSERYEHDCSGWEKNVHRHGGKDGSKVRLPRKISRGGVPLQRGFRGKQSSWIIIPGKNRNCGGRPPPQQHKTGKDTHKSDELHSECVSVTTKLVIRHGGLTQRMQLGAQTQNLMVEDMVKVRMAGSPLIPPYSQMYPVTAALS
mgnify:CR=1 FL=1